MARFIGKRHNGAGQATLGEHVVARCSLLCRTLQNNCKAQEATIESTGAILGLLGIGCFSVIAIIGPCHTFWRSASLCFVPEPRLQAWLSPGETGSVTTGDVRVWQILLQKS